MISERFLRQQEQQSQLQGYEVVRPFYRTVGVAAMRLSNFQGDSISLDYLVSTYHH